MSAEMQKEKSAAGADGAAASANTEREQDILPRLFYGLLIAAGGVGAVMALQHSLDDYWVLLLVSLYAAMGVFFLLCAAFGLCRFGLKAEEKAAAADVLDNLAPAIVLTDKKGRFIYGNKAYRRLAGVSLRPPEILLGRDAAAAPAACRLSEAAVSGSARHEILRFRRNPFAAANSAETGGGAVYAVDVRPFFSGGYRLAIWTISETGGETADGAAQQGGASVYSLQEAVNYFDNAPAGFLSWDGAARAVFFNASLARFTDYDFSSVSAVPKLADLLGAENAEKVFAWGQALKSRAGRGSADNAPLHLPINVADRRGGQRRIYFCADCARSEDGLFHALIVPEDSAFAQISAPPSRENTGGSAAGNFTEDFGFASYFYRSPIALALIRRNWQNMEFNSCFGALFGLDTEAGRQQNAADSGRGSEEMISRFFAALAEPYRAHLTAALKTGFEQMAAAPIAVEAVAQAQNAEEEPRYIRFYITPVGNKAENEAGAPAAIIISAVEVTRQRALERQMEHSEKMQAVGQLAGGIAHDFNNVLTAIIMSCDLLLSSHRISDPSHPDIINIKHNAERAASLVRQLLAFSRRQTLRAEILDITDMLADLRMLAIRLAGNNVELKIEHGRGLWPVKADQTQLQRVIMNLVSNARDAMPQGGFLTIRTENISETESRSLPYPNLAAGDYVLIEVADTGAGIPSDIIGKIFDPFFTTKEVGKGTGLGLSSVYGIVSQTGGHIYCRSAVGEGTIFSIYLPRAVIPDNAAGEAYVFNDVAEDFGRGYVADAAAEGGDKLPAVSLGSDGGERHYPHERAEAGADAVSGRSAGGRAAIWENRQKQVAAADLSGSANVLLVEDEDAVRMGGVKALQSRGYTVFEAESGVEALRVVKERQGEIDIVVSDVVMPEMDGPSLLRELRLTYPEIKFIFVSGYAREAFAKNLPADTEFSFLPKPFSLKQLASAVKDVLQGNIVG